MRAAAALLIALSFAAQAQVMAMLVSQRAGTSVTGQMITICVYSYNGARYEMIVGLGQSCPYTLMLR